MQGDLNDPKFRVGKVVVRVIENILVKVATSPFSLLGAVFGGGGEELGQQEFAPGSAELTATDKSKLDSLLKGLYARPALNLEITGSVDVNGDREGLQRAAIDREIRTRLWQKFRKAEQATNSVDAIFVDGCFWHGCPKHSKTPASNRDFWEKKLADNKTRDRRVNPELRRLGWRVIGIWEHDLAKRGAACIRRIRRGTG